MTDNSKAFLRTGLLLGTEAMEKLKSSRIAVFGIGGVGGYVVEALARSGVGALDIIDNDVVDITNINRQIIATRSKVGMPKTEVAAERIKDINPDCSVRTYRTFYLPENRDEFDFTLYDYVVDAIDTVTGKLTIIEQALAAGVPVISCMGTGNKLDPTKLKVADVYDTSICPLAKVMRHECRKRGIKALKCVYSAEEPITPVAETGQTMETKGNTGRPAPGSVAFVPSVAGLIIAGEVIKELTGY